MSVFFQNGSIGGEVIGRVNALKCEIGTGYIISKGTSGKIYGTLYEFKISVSEIMKILREPDYITTCFNRNTEDYRVINNIRVFMYDNTVVDSSFIYLQGSL